MSHTQQIVLEPKDARYLESILKDIRTDEIDVCTDRKTLKQDDIKRCLKRQYGSSRESTKKFLNRMHTKGVVVNFSDCQSDKRTRLVTFLCDMMNPMNNDILRELFQGRRGNNDNE